MSILKIARTALAASALAMLPANAVAAAASTTAAAPVRAAAPLTEDNGQAEGLGGYIIPIVIVVALGVGLYFALKDDDDSAASA